MKKEISRRSFLKTGAFAALGMSIAPTALLGKEAEGTVAPEMKDSFPSPKNADIHLDEGVSVYGYVGTSKGPLAGVMVSDGVEVAVTNEEGIYQLVSEKELGYVFISVPSGYEVGSDGVLPQHYRLLRNLPNHKERVDFALTPKKGQDKFKLFMLGDMHLMRDEKDAPAQFKMFTDDLSEYMAAHRKEIMYAITLGDMAWDVFWYNRDNIFFPEYLDIMNEGLPGLQVFHTMGNHDNDWKADNDRDAEKTYIQYLGPTYYSFNIGKIHFVVLDNIDCTPYNGTMKYSYLESISDRQFEWLKKDLALIDKSTPIILTTHAQLFYPYVAVSPASNGVEKSRVVGKDYTSEEATRFVFHRAADRKENTQKLLDIIKDYRVHVVTGHSHLIFNVTPDDDVVKGMNIYEHNSGAICATWWTTEWLVPGVNIAKDGAPAGYGIWDIDGEDIKYMFKGYGISEDIQFRTYDLNNVFFTMDDVPNMNKDREDLVAGWNKYCEFYPKNNDNEVLINVWNWNRYWKIEVTDESGRTFDCVPVCAYDPLHIISLSRPQFNKPRKTSYPYDTTNLWTHFFKVKTDSPDSTLLITVTDEFGRVYKERMIRPKAFNTSVYARH